MSLVSVIIPSFNHEKYLGEAIESVLNQSITDLEIIIIDDKSLDNSREIIREFAKKDHRIKAKFNSKNQGIAKTANYGIKCANSKFTAFMASDDVWSSLKLEKQLDVLKNNEDQVVWCDGEIIDSDSINQGQKFTEYYNVPQKSGFIFEELIKGNYIFGSSVLLKTENLKKLMLDENLAFLNDHKLYLDLAYHYPFYFISEPLAKYRIHGENTTFRDLSGWNKDAMVLSDHLMNKYGSTLSFKSKKNIFYLACRNPIHHCMERDPWNKNNIFYMIALPIWYFFIIIKYI